MIDPALLPATVDIERRSPAGVLLERRIVPFMGFYGRGHAYANISWNREGTIQRSFKMSERGRGTGAFGKAGWCLSSASLGVLQNLRNPRALTP
jgi:hypothetical protein